MQESKNQPVNLSLSKPMPKMLDIRFRIPWLLGGLFVVFEIRRGAGAGRLVRMSTAAKIAWDLLMAAMLFVIVGLFVFGVLYMLKITLNIDLFFGWSPFHE